MSSIIHAVVAPSLIALSTSAAVIVLMIGTGASKLALDRPNQRSLHSKPTPRLGGVGIVAGLAAAWAYAAPEFDFRVTLGFWLLAAISLFDDLKSVSVAWRLVLHFVSSLLAMTALLYSAHGILPTLAAAVITTWIINLYNFMDGSDGLAGGMAVLGFGTYGAVALVLGDVSFAAICFTVAAAALGFLVFNFPPAKVFMGDVGAIPMGYLATVLGISGWLRDDWPLWFGAVVFSPFIVDATVTLIKRAARGAKVWQAHREHYYQRLVQTGWGHRKTAFAEYGLMVLSCSIAAGAMLSEGLLQTAILAALPLLYIILIIVLERSFSRSTADHG